MRTPRRSKSAHRTLHRGPFSGSGIGCRRRGSPWLGACDWLPEEHLARFVADLVDEHLDLSRIHAAYTEGRGGPPYDPRLMVRILLYGYTTGMRSSRAIERKCVDDVPFRWLAAGAAAG
ncbi:unnamed protein product [marine sediment metagenome]|uniref:Transposase InsH N-terminal domain-containing protein n=1 Tax=marine sediment metagenome TaxID=412755 RepID=X1EVY8_9ZZZZ